MGHQGLVNLNTGSIARVGSTIIRTQPLLAAANREGGLLVLSHCEGRMGYPAGKGMATSMDELGNLLNPEVALRFWQNWEAEQDTIWGGNRLIARDLPSNRDCMKLEHDVYRLRLVALSGQVLCSFGVYGNLLAWKLYLCVERILLIQSHHFSLARGESLLPRNEKYVAAYLWNKEKGRFMDINVVFHPEESCKWCMRASEHTTWDCQGVQIKIPTKCPCAVATDAYRPLRSWAHLLNLLAQQYRLALARNLDPIDQRNLTGAGG